MSANDLREYIGSLIRDNPERTAELSRSLGLPASRAALASAFSAAVDRKFGPYAGKEEIAEFVRTMREKYVAPDAIHPMMAESILRAALSEGESLDEFPRGDLVRGQVLILYSIAQDLRFERESLESFLDEAEDLAREWLAAHGSSNER